MKYFQAPPHALSVIIKRALLLSAVMVLVSACASASIVANRDTAYQGQLGRLVVLVRHQGADDDAETFRQALATEFSAVNLPTVTYVLTETTGANAAEITAFAPDAVLKVTAISTGLMFFGERAEIGYDVTLNLVGEESSVWRATVNHSGDGFMMTTRIEKAAKTIVDKLLSDRLLKAPRG